MINNVKEYLNQFTKGFKIIAVSEIWINAETGMDFQLDFSTQERGGGLCTWIKNRLQGGGSYDNCV